MIEVFREGNVVSLQLTQNGSDRKIKVSKHGKILTIRKSTRRVNNIHCTTLGIFQ